MPTQIQHTMVTTTKTSFPDPRPPSPLHRIGNLLASFPPPPLRDSTSRTHTLDAHTQLRKSTFRLISFCACYICCAVVCCATSFRRVLLYRWFNPYMNSWIFWRAIVSWVTLTGSWSGGTSQSLLQNLTGTESGLFVVYFLFFKAAELYSILPVCTVL